MKLLHMMTANLKSTIWRYYAFNFFTSLHFFSAVLVPFFTDWGGLTLFHVQLIQSWFAFWIFILEVPTGAIADYFGRKYSLLVGAIVTVGATLLYGTIAEIGVFLVSEFLFALGIALMSGADEALLYDSLREQGRESESTKIFGRAHSFNLLGMLVAAAFGGGLASQFGLNTPMLLTSIPFLIATIIAWTIREPQIAPTTSEQKRYLDVAKNGWHYFKSHPALKLMALDAIGVSAAAYFVIWLYQPLLQSLNFPIAYFGFIHAGMIATEMVIASNFSLLERLAGSARRYLRASALITGLAFIAVASYPSALITILFVLIAGGIGLTRLSFMNAQINGLIESDQRATVLSFVSMLRRLSYAVLNPIVGLVATQSLRGALLMVGILPLLVFVFSPLRKKDSLSRHQQP